MKVSIVVRAYNEDEHIEKLLLGIQAQSLRNVEVVLVDSGSTDDTVAIAQRYGVKLVSIAKHEFTFGRALNLGCAAASGDICVFASAHVYPVHACWLERLVEPFLKSEQVVLSYGRQRGNHLNKYSEHQIFARWFPPESVFPQKSYFCNNANCAIRRSAWETQPYDETLTGLEDLAWAKEAQAKGGLIAYVAEADIVHVHDESWSQVMNRYRREAIAMRSIDSHQKFTRGDFAWLLARNVASDVGIAARERVLHREFGSILRFRFNQLRGTYIGYNGPPEVTAELRARFYYPTTPHDRRIAHGDRARHRIDYDALLEGRAARAEAPVQVTPPAKVEETPPSAEVVPIPRRHR